MVRSLQGPRVPRLLKVLPIGGDAGAPFGGDPAQQSHQGGGSDSDVSFCLLGTL